MQLLYSLGLTHGLSGRGLSPADVDKLAAEREDFLLPLLSHFYAADGTLRILRHNVRLEIAQGRLCGHESLVRAQQPALPLYFNFAHSLGNFCACGCSVPSLPACLEACGVGQQGSAAEQPAPLAYFSPGILRMSQVV